MATVTEILRRLYHDLVRRRARVRVVVAEEAELAEDPIFVLGVYGSGTTLLRYLLDSHSRICCPPETDFLGALAELHENPDYRQGLDALGFDEEAVLSRSRSFAAGFYENYARSWSKPRWADKSPSYVDRAEFLARLFPTARFVLLFRHGLDQAHSYTRGGSFPRPTLSAYEREGEDLRLACVRYWVDRCNSLLDFENRHPERCHRLRYEDLCSDPEGLLPGLFSFLGEDWEPGVLDFAERDHDQGNEHGRVIATRRLEARSGHYEKWDTGLRERCLEVAGDVLRRLGYAVDEV